MGIGAEEISRMAVGRTQVVTQKLHVDIAIGIGTVSTYVHVV